MALHGFNHVYSNKNGGINPINYKSEFAGLPLDEQMLKIEKGIQILKEHNITPNIFFAPAHTFDLNTLIALREKSSIRIISDTIANKSYHENGFTFVPQQSGKCRFLLLNEVTFCLHPNTMTDKDFVHLEKFLKKYNRVFRRFPIIDIKRKKSFFDSFLSKLYFARRKK